MTICAPIIGAAIGAIGSVMQGVMAQQMSNYQSKVAKANAEAAIAEGYANAGAVRGQFDEVRGQQAAATGKAGVDPNSGSALALGLETQRREEVASSVEIWKGRTEQTRYLNEAKAAKAEGRANLFGGIIGGVSSLVGGLSGLGQGRALSLGQSSPQAAARPQPLFATGSIPIAPRRRMNPGMY